jgi:hypothetical protein
VDVFANPRRKIWKKSSNQIGPALSQFVQEEGCAIAGCLVAFSQPFIYVFSFVVSAVENAPDAKQAGFDAYRRQLAKMTGNNRTALFFPAERHERESDP